MSRLTGNDAKGLMEAYNAVYAPQQEEVVEEVLDEAPMTAFQAAGGQAKLDQLNKNRSPRAGRVTASQLERQGQQNLYKAGGGDAAIAKGPTRSQNVRGGGTRQVPTLTRQDIINRGSVAAGSTPKPAAPAARPAAPAARPAAPAARPAAPSPGGSNKPPVASPAPTAKAAPAPTPTKTANPLLKDNSISDMIKASQARQAGTNVTSDNIASVRQSVQQANRPEVLNRPAPAGTALAKQQQAQGTTVSGSGAMGSAANPQVRAQLGLKPINPAPADQKKKVTVAAGTDLFDIVKGHLMSEGYADTEEAALVIMANMSEDWKQQILDGGKKG